MRRGSYQHKTPPDDWRRQPRGRRSGGRKRIVPAKERAQLYVIMKVQREMTMEIDRILDSVCPRALRGRNRTAVLRRIYLEKGR